MTFFRIRGTASATATAAHNDVDDANNSGTGNIDSADTTTIHNDYSTVDKHRADETNNNIAVDVGENRDYESDKIDDASRIDTANSGTGDSTCCLSLKVASPLKPPTHNTHSTHTKTEIYTADMIHTPPKINMKTHAHAGSGLGTQTTPTPTPSSSSSSSLIREIFGFDNSVRI